MSTIKILWKLWDQLTVFTRKFSIWTQRYQKSITAVFYGIIILLSLYAIYDPVSFFEFFLPGSSVDGSVQEDPSKSDEFQLFFRFTTTPRIIPPLRMVKLPFAPNMKHSCEDIFHKSGRNFTYSEFYWEHMDAFKSALSITAIMEESNVNEQSWAFHEIAKLNFVTNVCETGFFAGHNTFQWLTAKPDVTVYSFEPKMYNWTEDMATFMSAEFPDHFYFFQGNTEVTLPKFWQENNKTLCDVVYIDSSANETDIMFQMEKFRSHINPVENLFVMDVHGDMDTSLASKMWKMFVNKGYILEHFSCSFGETGDPLSTRFHNVSGFLVGSFLNQKGF